MVASMQLSADTKLVWKGVNPKQKASKAYERFEKYSKATTVGQFFELGGSRMDLAHDQKKGFVQACDGSKGLVQPSTLKRPSSAGPAEKSSATTASAAEPPAVEAPQKSPAKVSASSPKTGPVVGASKGAAGKVGKVLAAMKKAAAAAPLKSKAQAKGKVMPTPLPAVEAVAAAAAAVASAAAGEAAAALATADASAKAKAVKKSILKRPEGGKAAEKETLAPAPASAAAAGAAVTVGNKVPDPKTPLTWIDGNPKSVGSMAHVRFAKYRGAPTVEAFLKRGGVRGDLMYDCSKGFVKFGKAAEKK